MGITQIEVAARSGVHRNTIYRAEAGLTVPTILQLWKIAQAMDAKIEDFLQDSPSKVRFALESEKAL
ncbi:helix-turn-helix domain-containing protein [Acidicapsa dinghuensis]|uniref:Helix-turn-helix domain-containing protein n=1 Tax=Acidicapsa dinghuensis TaxID=2218256 RepID=A0ABW1EAT8_9BACT